MSKSAGTCVFNKAWIIKYPWITDVENRYKAKCKDCHKTFDIRNMGEAAVKSHAKSEKHKKASRPRDGMDLGMYFPKTASSTSASVDENNMTVPDPPTATNVPPNNNIPSFVNRNTLLKSEVLWTLHSVVTHCSFKSNETVCDIFKEMFPDSEIAKRFTCGERKTSYISMFGLADHFRQQTLDEVKGYFVLMFDESLNQKLQEKQMDIHVRYWDVMQNSVATRYLGSQFLGHAKAEDLVQAVKAEVVDHLNVRDMLQISMDGPNVNLKLLKIFQEEVNTDFGHSLIDIGSCGLHSLHNAFKLGVSEAEWDVSSVLSSLYNLFLNDAPARKEDFLECAGGFMKRLPLKFVNHRWLENVPVCQRAILIWPHVVEYVKRVQSKKYTKPTCKSFQVLVEAVKDQFIYVKFEFFCLIANILQPFLGNFQSDKPLVPFLSVELANLVKGLMRRVIKRDILDEADTAEKLSKIDISDKDNYVNYKKVNIGLAAEEKLKNVKASDRQMLEFRVQCRSFIVGVLRKILEKSPLKYSAVRNLSCLDPRLMASDKSTCNDKMKRLTKYLVSINRLSFANGEKVLQEYASFLDTIMGSCAYTGFLPFSDGLDEFLFSKMSPHYPELLNVTQMLLVLSHGQASVERGFSINKKVEVENLSHRGLVARRIICEHVKRAGGVLKVPISNKLLVSVASSRQKYENYLASERQKNKSAEQERKRKLVMEEVDSIKKRKKQTESDIDHLEKRVETLCDKAEVTAKLELLSEANAARRKIKEKKILLAELVTKLEKQLEELKK